MGLISIPKSIVDIQAVNTSEKLETLDLLSFIRASGVTLESISPKQLGYFLAARSLLPLIKELKLPSARISEDSDHTARISNKISTNHSAADDAIERFPTQNFTLGPARVSELKDILPYQFCYPQEQLLYLLANGKIMRRHMIPDNEPHPDLTNNSETESVEQDNNSKQSSAQRAYLLLDVSQSMNGDRSPERETPDRRGVIARGLALAFLYDARERSSNLHFRPFSSTVGERDSAREPTELKKLVQNILEIKNAGSTALQAGLAAAASDLYEIDPEARIDIMLITDGVSHLSQNPIYGKHLHTFLIGDSLPPSTKGQAGVLDKLCEWSESFKRIWDREFVSYLRPRRQDIAAFESLLADLNEKIPNCKNEHEMNEIKNIINLVDELVGLISLVGSNDPSMTTNLLKIRDETIQKLGSAALRVEVAQRERAFQELCELYDANLPQQFRAPAQPDKVEKEKLLNASVTIKGSAAYSDLSPAILLQALYRQIVRYVRNWRM